MKYFAGLDVSLQETSVCVVDETGQICREMKVVSHPDDLVLALKNPGLGIGPRRAGSRPDVAMAI